MPFALLAAAFYVITDAGRPHLGPEPKPEPLDIPLWFLLCAVAFDAALVFAFVRLISRVC